MSHLISNVPYDVFWTTQVSVMSTFFVFINGISSENALSIQQNDTMHASRVSFCASRLPLFL